MVAPLVISPLILLSGLMVNIEQASIVIRWMQYISPVRYGGEALLRNEFDGNDRYDFNPIPSLNLNVGFANCILYLAVISFVLRILALIALRLRVTKAQ